jgi:hypothetical protein
MIGGLSFEILTLYTAGPVPPFGLVSRLCRWPKDVTCQSTRLLDDIATGNNPHPPGDGVEKYAGEN